MPAEWIGAIVSVIIVSLVSLVGLAAISINERILRPAITAMVSLAVGVMFGNAFIHLLPESFASSSRPSEISIYIVIGIFTAIMLDRLLHWGREHHIESVHHVGYMNLIADGLCNLVDGLLIGSAYLAGTATGVATTVAVLLHEIPQEISDFGVLLHSGFTRKQALLLNLLTASVAIVGVFISLLAGSNIKYFSHVMLPLAAGLFIYIAGSELIPELRKELDPAKSFGQLFMMAVGFGVMLLLHGFE